MKNRTFSLLLLAALAALAAGCGGAGDPLPPDCDVTQWADSLAFDPAAGAPTTSLFQCEPRTPDISSSGAAACVVIEASNDAACACDAADGLEPVPSERAGAVEVAQANAASRTCFCQVRELEGEARRACQEDASDPPLVGGEPVGGWCYLDATLSPPLGNPELVQGCPSTEQRAIRIVGSGVPSQDATLVLICEQQTCGG